LIWFKGPCVLPFINKFKTADPDVFIVEIKFLTSIYWMADINTLPDVCGGDFVDISLKTDGGIVIDHPFMPNKKYFIQLRFSRPGDIGVTA